MRFRSLTTGLVVTVLLALQGCRNSGGEEPQELSGVFQAGNVSGVSYQTATRHGVTDAAGTFHYLPGETVTFFIGGTVFGSVPGSSVITPFTLAGSPPPTTELALRRELDRTRRVATPLGRALNMTTLMMALDADGNPANGIDIGARSASLAGVILNVDQHIGAFAASMHKNITGLTANIPMSQTLAHLYGAAGVIVPAHVNTRSDTTTDSPFVFPHQASRATYAADGRRLTQTHDVNDDGQDERDMVWTYDARGRVIGTASQSSSSIFSLPVRIRNSVELDASGHRIGTTSERDSNGDEVYETREVARFENDAHGFVTLMQADIYRDGDDVVDGRVTQRYTYDARHNVTRNTFEPDNDADGVVDQISVGETEYDASNRPVSNIDSTDADADGVVDYRYVTTYHYDNGPAATREVTQQDDDDDGIFESQSVITRTFDAAGNLLLQLQEHDAGLDGTIDSVWRAELTYDGQRRTLSQSTEFDTDADGVVDSWSNTTSSYDDVGNLLVGTMEQGGGGIGALAVATTSRYEYGTSGELLEMTSETTFNGQAQPLQDTTTTVSSEVLADGVLALGQEYFEGFGNLLSGPWYGGVVGPIFLGPVYFGDFVVASN